AGGRGRVVGVGPGGAVVDPVLAGSGLLTTGFPVVETGKFIAEEEILRRRELRSPVESRRSLTKFVTIIVIAASPEALVMVFKTSRASIPDAIYPAALFIAAMFALVALGGYQWLSSRINPEIPPGDPSGEGRSGEGRSGEGRSGRALQEDANGDGDL
ncbi:MAG: hypothetical protein ACFE0R_19180, partial [Salinarimonas sp.]